MYRYNTKQYDCNVVNANEAMLLILQLISAFCAQVGVCVLNDIVSMNLYSASLNALQSEALPVRDTGKRKYKKLC